MYCRYHDEHHHGSMRKILCKAHIEYVEQCYIRGENSKPWKTFVKDYLDRTDPKIRKAVNRIREIVEAAKAHEGMIKYKAQLKAAGGEKTWERAHTESTPSSVTQKDA